jgi:hypothetical protein
MLFKSKLITILAVSTLLVACGGGGEDSSSGEYSSISSFEVVGTSADANGVTPINANVNEGRFHLKWKASSDGPIYRASMYLSKDDKLDKNGVDNYMMRQNCGSISTLYNCGETADFSCRFTTENDMYCFQGSLGNRGKNIGDWLGALPKSIYMILEVCNGLGTSCKTKATKVILQ